MHQVDARLMPMTSSWCHDKIQVDPAKVIDNSIKWNFLISAHFQVLNQSYSTRKNQTIKTPTFFKTTSTPHFWNPWEIVLPTPPLVDATALPPRLKIHRPVCFPALCFHNCSNIPLCAHHHKPSQNQYKQYCLCLGLFWGIQQPAPEYSSWKVFTLESTKEHTQLGRGILLRAQTLYLGRWW